MNLILKNTDAVIESNTFDSRSNLLNPQMVATFRGVSFFPLTTAISAFGFLLRLAHWWHYRFRVWPIFFFLLVVTNAAD
jgi:D-alanyl-D-alanine dipeptidase